MHHSLSLKVLRTHSQAVALSLKHASPAFFHTTTTTIHISMPYRRRLINIEHVFVLRFVSAEPAVFSLFRATAAAALLSSRVYAHMWGTTTPAVKPPQINHTHTSVHATCRYKCVGPHGAVNPSIIVMRDATSLRAVSSC